MGSHSTDIVAHTSLPCKSLAISSVHRTRGELHRHVERDARPTVVHALERHDVGVVATTRDDHVALADRGPARGIERVPIAHPGLDPRVALTAHRSRRSMPSVVGIEVARRVPRRDAGRPQHRERRGARSPGRPHAVPRAPRPPSSTRRRARLVHHVVPDPRARARRARRPVSRCATQVVGDLRARRRRPRSSASRRDTRRGGR